jgi:hypothetical protein
VGLTHPCSAFECTLSTTLALLPICVVHNLRVGLCGVQAWQHEGWKELLCCCLPCGQQGEQRPKSAVEERLLKK